jgi:hypothetical protein
MSSRLFAKNVEETSALGGLPQGGVRLHQCNVGQRPVESIMPRFLLMAPICAPGKFTNRLRPNVPIRRLLLFPRPGTNLRVFVLTL